MRCSCRPIAFAIAAGLLAILAAPSGTNGWQDVPEDDGQAWLAELEQLQSRRLAPRADKTVFSPLELPAPSRVRTATGLPGEDYWQQQVDYDMDISLDAETEVVSGVARVTYTNNSPQALPFLWLSLEQNLFREDSDGSKFTPPGSRFNNSEGFNGGYTIDHVRLGDEELKLNVYDTVGRLELPAPVPPRGGQVTFEIGWSFQVPDYGADRMGIRRVKQGKVFQLAQWFPAVCKFDDVHGWNTLPYLGQGEFYTDYGKYNVRITAPRGHMVCATGELKNAELVMSAEQYKRLCLAQVSPQTVIIREEEEIGTPAAAPEGEGPLTWEFAADKVRTFAWTSSDATIYDACSVQWDDGKTTLVQSVYPREAKSAWSESSQMLRYSIMNYSRQWFRYPYPVATNVNGVCGGMEYPMIIFCGSDRNKRGLFDVTSHEIGHNWFPMTVNTDERRFAWMDEGFNTFINAYDKYDEYEHEVHGTELPTRTRGFTASSISRQVARPGMQPLDLPADQIRPELLGSLAYNKTAMAMRMLREVVLGPERFDPAFKQYIAEWAFKSPQPADFFRCMENGTGMDLAWYWRGWFVESLALDQAIVSVRESTRSRRARIELANRREMVMPVQLKVEYTDGSESLHSLPVYIWHYTNLWETDIPTEGRAIAKVTVDPNRVMPDLDRKNNIWTRPEEEEGEEADRDAAPEESPPADAAASGEPAGDSPAPSEGRDAAATEGDSGPPAAEGHAVNPGGGGDGDGGPGG